MFLFIIAINHVGKHPQLERKCMSVAVEINKFLELYRDPHVSYLYAVYVALPSV